MGIWSAWRDFTVSSRTTYTVTGMTCQHCVASVTEELSELDGVTGVAVDLATGVVTVDSSAQLDWAAIKAAAGEAGYALVS
jgi:copper chaperone